MNKKDFNKLITSIKQAGRIRGGGEKPGRVFISGPDEIKAIRKKLHISQSKFAILIGVNTATLQNWEQGRRFPTGPACALLRVAAKNPEIVYKALCA